MRKFTTVALCLMPFFAVADEDCSPEAIGVGDKSTKIELLFYTGTCHYRNEDYQLSVQSWEKLVGLKASTSTDEALKVDVLNNLGYMKFFGFGTKTDKRTAISFWREAILLGHYEAEYHLCHAYADSDQPTYDIAKARKHCEKARLIYKGKDDSDPEILEDIEKYIKMIRG
jgi:TPR repeat protein